MRPHELARSDGPAPRGSAAIGGANSEPVNCGILGIQCAFRVTCRRLALLVAVCVVVGGLVDSCSGAQVLSSSKPIPIKLAILLLLGALYAVVEYLGAESNSEVGGSPGFLIKVFRITMLCLIVLAFVAMGWVSRLAGER